MSEKPRSRFRCVSPDCGATFALDRLIYQCERCASLLAVEHDLAARQALGDASWWRSRFEGRPFGADFASSGVWAYHEWVLPDLPEQHIISLGEGRSPLLETGEPLRRRGDPPLSIKLCGREATGSFKDLGMTVLVSWVHHLRTTGTPIRAMLCASTGDTSAALAAYGARAGIPTVVLLPRGKISSAQLLQALAHGALTLALDTDFDGCMALVRDLARMPGFYLANSMNSLRIEGQKTVAFEIAQQCRWQPPEWVIVPGGNLGNVSALAKGFEELRAMGLIARAPRLVCAQAEHANPLYRSFRAGWAPLEPIRAKATAATAIRIGNPVSFPKARAALSASGGLVEQADEAELAEAAALADRAGFFACPHTAVALAAWRKLVDAGTIACQQRAVVVATAHGLKFTDFKLAYHEDRLINPESGAPMPAKAANRPLELPATIAAVEQALARRFPDSP